MEVNNYIERLQDNITIYLKEIENESFDLTEYLELKVNNYLISIKEEVIYEFYKYLQKKEYEIDVIEKYKNRLSTKLDDIDIQLGDNKYCSIKKEVIQQLMDLKDISYKMIDAKVEDCSVSYKRTNAEKIFYQNVRREYIKKKDDFERKLKETLDINESNYFSITDDLCKQTSINSINSRRLKREYGKKFDIIQSQINEQILIKSKMDFLKSVNNILQTIIKTLKEAIELDSNTVEEDAGIDCLEKEKIENILITTSSGRKIAISIEYCRTNMNEISFNRAMSAINRLIKEVDE